MSTPLPTEPTDSQTDDPYLWLEDVAGERSLAWVREQNAATVSELEAGADFTMLRRRLLSIFDSRERIPRVAKEEKRGQIRF